MPTITLKSLIGKNKDATAVIRQLLEAMDSRVSVVDTQDLLLLGDNENQYTETFPVMVGNDRIGFVRGDGKAGAIASLLSHLADKEMEKKSLGSEVLNLYRELNLIYNFSENIAALLDLESVARTTLAQARQMLSSTDGAVMLVDEDSQQLNIVASFGDHIDSVNHCKLDEGIVGRVVSSRNAEIINDVYFHPGYTFNGPPFRSMVIAPLKMDKNILGVIVLGNTSLVTYTAGDLKLLNTLALQTATAVENALLFQKTIQAAKDRETLLAMTKELEVASNIQKSMVPRRFPPFPDRDDFEILADMIPAKEVGGDFYDFFLIDEHRLGFVIGDVSGKGVPAALFMALSRTLLKATALTGVSVELCMESVNHLLASESVPSMFVTICYGILDTRSGWATYCCGGHHPPYLLRQQGPVEMLGTTGGIAMGIMKNATYKSKQIKLEKGDVLFLYTDGVTEAMDMERHEFSDGRLERCLSAYRTSDLSHLFDRLREEVKTFAGEAPQADDLTILALRFNG